VSSLTLKSLRPLLALLAALAVIGLAACGDEERRTTGDEGEFIDVGETDYQVQLTRLLNPQARPDSDLLRGQAPLGKDEAFLATFLRINNQGDRPYQPPRDLKVKDTQDNEYLPLDTTQAAGFGLDFGRPIPADESAPDPDSPAALGPDHAALLLFRVKRESVDDNLPLELEIPAEGQEEPSRIELDL
jgi:hypothetical protein